MSNMTKLALEAALKKLLLQKPLDKITINDLTEECGISRMTFYYHFKDIYDLVEWACIEDGKRALKDKKTYDTWREGICQIFEAVLENKPFIMNVYHTVSRQKVENYLYKLTYQLIADVVEEKSANAELPEESKRFIAEFYKYAFVGVMLDWIDRGMKEEYTSIVERMYLTMYGNIANSIHNFEHPERIDLSKQEE
ncbi:MAG: TetR/AcrR family transcriptional regulator [Roseburia sp.]